MAKKGRYVYEWPRPMVTVDAVVFRFQRGKVQVLLVRRGKEPFRGLWALPGGFVEIDEELEDAVTRELAEETGLVGVPLRQMYTFGKCGRDPRGRQITIVHMGVVEGRGGRLKAGDDANAAKWFAIDKLPLPLAFDHEEAIRMAVSRLKRTGVWRRHMAGQ